MASCFTNPNKKKLSAKDYIIKRRRSAIFCEIRNRMLVKANNEDFTPTGNNIGCVNGNGIFTKFNNHESQLDMLSAFEDFRTDLLKLVQGQKFGAKFCPPYDISKNNIGIRNNYVDNNIQLAYGGDAAGYGHLTDYFGALNQNIISVSSSGFENTYAEIKNISSDLEEDLQTFKNNKFFLEKPPSCDNKTRPQVLLPGDLSAPELLGVTILIE